MKRSATPYLVGLIAFGLITLALLGSAVLVRAAGGDDRADAAWCGSSTYSSVCEALSGTEAFAGDVEARRGGTDTDTDTDSEGRGGVQVVFTVGCIGLVILLVVLVIIASVSNSGQRDD